MIIDDGICENCMARNNCDVLPHSSSCDEIRAIAENDKEVYNKAIDDFSTTLVTRLTDAIHSKDVGSMRNLINEISEQLKDGGKDGGENETELPNIKDKDCKSIGYSYAYKTDCEGDRYIKLDEVMYFLKCERNKAIDDFVNACKDNILCQTFGLHQNGIEKIAEQLKAGGEHV